MKWKVSHFLEEQETLKSFFAPTFQDQPFVENNFVSFRFVMQNFFLIPFNGLESESQKPSWNEKAFS